MILLQINFLLCRDFLWTPSIQNCSLYRMILVSIFHTKKFQIHNTLKFGRQSRQRHTKLNGEKLWKCFIERESCYFRACCLFFHWRHRIYWIFIPFGCVTATACCKFEAFKSMLFNNIFYSYNNSHCYFYLFFIFWRMKIHWIEYENCCVKKKCSHFTWIFNSTR